MTLRAAVSLTLARTRYDAHAADVAIVLATLPAVGSARVSLPSRVPISAAPGDEAIIALEAGDGPVPVLTGRVRAIRAATATTEVLIADAGAELGALRPSVTYQRQGAREVMRALAHAAGVAIGAIDIDLPLAAYAAHAGRTAAEHVAFLALLGDAIARIDAGGALVVTPPDDRATVALRHGRDLIAFDDEARAPPSAELVPIGAGPGQLEAPDALRPTTATFPPAPPAAGRGALWLAAPILRSAGAARTAHGSLARREGATARRVTATCPLSPHLRPGLVVEVQERPGRPIAPFRITWVRHAVGDAGGTTQLEATGTAGQAGVLGTAGRALGGLP